MKPCLSPEVAGSDVLSLSADLDRVIEGLEFRRESLTATLGKLRAISKALEGVSENLLPRSSWEERQEQVRTLREVASQYEKLDFETLPPGASG